jgi:P4 family phage/plasmid primase-like protien
MTTNAPSADSVPATESALPFSVLAAVRRAKQFRDEVSAVVNRRGIEHFTDLGVNQKTGETYRILTKVGAAKLFIETFGHEMKWVQSERHPWYICSRSRRLGYWASEDREGSSARMQAVIGVLHDEGAWSREDPRNPGFIGSALTLAKPHLAMRFDDFNADPYLLGTPNYVIDLRTGDQLKADPEMFLLNCTQATLPRGFSYDWGYDFECPAWLNHLRVMMRQGESITSDADQDEIAFLQELVGMSLVGEQRDHRFPFLHGNGRNGKGIFFETLAYVLGDYAEAVDPQVLFRRGNEHTTGFTDFRGKRFTYLDEVPAGKLDTGTLKRLTGGGILKGRRIGQDNQTWRATHTIWMASNFEPDFGMDTSAGLWSRVILIPTGPTIPEAARNNTILDQLRQESRGILAWCIEGARRYVDRGRLPDLPKRFRAATDEMEANSKYFLQFLSERYKKVEPGEPESKYRLLFIRQEFQTWGESHGFLTSSEPVTSNRIKSLLKDEHFTVKKATGNQVHVFGIRPKTAKEMTQES